MLLPEMRADLGPDFPIIVDSGVRDGGDVAVALALGASFCAIGRAYLYPLAVAGEAGVRLAISQLRSQLERTMALIGVSDLMSLRQLGPELLVSA
jgi:L-lactate dehydrogenase (cytochrome)